MDSNQEVRMRYFAKPKIPFPIKYAVLFLIPLVIFCGFSSAKRESINASTIDPDPFLWPELAPEAQGIDSSLLSHAFDQAEKLQFVNSVLIVKNGYLIGERYFNQKDKYFSDHICSASKSFISPLIGIALENNFLVDLEQKLVDFFPEFITPQMDPRKSDITIKHLLQMRAGFPFEESNNFVGRWLESENWIKFAFECNLSADPGQTYAYSTLSTHLLSGIITKSTGMSTFDFAKDYLFDPIGITVQKWDQDPHGYYTGGWRMVFSPRDMARFGDLYLNHGYLDGSQILSPDWIEESIVKYSTDVVWFQKHFTDFGFGYQWWLANAGGYDMYFAAGYGGQTFVNVPDLNMTIVTTARWNVSNQQAGTQINAVYDLIANYILAPIRCLNGPPPYFPSEVTAQKMINCGLAYREYLNVLRWQPNPRNAAVTITKYRIYRVIEESLNFLEDVNAETFEYWERQASKTKYYSYAISAITEDGQESIPAYVSTIYPAILE